MKSSVTVLFLNFFLNSLIGNLLLSSSAFAIKESAPLILQEVSNKYRKAGLVEMSVEKTVKLELMGTETKYFGTMYMAEGLFRLETEKPEKELLVFDGGILWNIQFPTSDFPGQIQVTKAKIDKKNRSQLLVGNLFSKEPLSKQLQIIGQSLNGSDITYEAKLETKEMSISALKISVDSKKLLFKSLSYLDDVGNLVTYNFSETQFKKKKKNSLFQYHPPKDAQVNAL